MTAETQADFSAYLSQNYEHFGLRIDLTPRYGHKPWFSPSYDHPESKIIGFEVPDSASGFAHLAGLLPSLVSEDLNALWRGGAVLYQDYDVWDHQNNVQAWTMIERIRAGFGELRPFSQATVNVFRDNDLAILPAFLLAPLIYGWNAYYIPQDRGSFAFVSHDGYWTIATETEEVYAGLQKKLAFYPDDHWIRKQRLLSPRM